MADESGSTLHDLESALEKIDVHDHLCLIYETQEEQFSAVIPFMRIGLERGEKCLYVIDDNTAAMVINEMKAAGLDVESAVTSGSLTIISTQETYLKQGFFDPDWMVGFLKQATDEAKTAGFSALRVTGEMTWMLGGDPGTERLMEYEAKLNSFFIENDALAICQYNRGFFPPESIKDVIDTHPLVICGGMVCSNSYYVSPDDLLTEERPAREIDRLLANIINRQKAEDELSRMNERFSLATHAARLGVWDWDIKSNELLWDDMMYELYGIKGEAFSGAYEAWLQGIHPDDRASSDEALKRARSGEREYDTEFRVVWPDGTIHYLKEYGRIVRNADGAPLRMIGINFDITARKSMDGALFVVAQRGWLADAENFFDALARYLGENLDMDYVVIDRIDENPAIAETVALYARGAIVPNMRYALKGTPCENVLGRQLCVYPQGVQQLFPEDNLLAEMGVQSYIGIPLWDCSGQPIGLIALMGSKPCSDAAPATQLLQLVAPRAAAELTRERNDRILRTREHEFRTLAESLPDSIVRYDREGRIIYVNPVLEKNLGAAAANMIGTSIREFHTNGSYEAYVHAVVTALASGENGEIEYILPVPGKEPIVHQIRLIVERDEHGEVTGVLAIGRDITERKRMEEERSVNLWYFESMDKVNRAIQGAKDLEGILSDVLDVVLAIFDCDRAFLLYPCDPAAAFWSVPVERCKPEYPGVLELGIDVPMSSDVAQTLRTLLEADGPVKFGPGTQHPLPSDASERFGFKSFMSMAFRPKIGSPWQFGLHQCDHVRNWTAEEERLFREIARRLADGLSTMLVYRDLRESERRFRDLLASVTSYMYTVVMDDGRAVSTTHGPGCLAVTGFSTGDYAADPDLWHRMIHPEDRQTVLEAAQRVLISNSPVTFEHRIQHKDGSIHWVQSTLVPCVNPEGQLLSYDGVITDITARKRAEENLLQLNEELEQRVRERTKELERRNYELEQMNKAFVGREVRMAELKQRIKELEKVTMQSG